MSEYVVERMTAEDLQPGAFNMETLDPINLKPKSIHWAVVLLDDNGEQTDDDFSFFPTRREAKASCEYLNRLLAQEAS